MDIRNENRRYFVQIFKCPGAWQVGEFSIFLPCESVIDRNGFLQGDRKRLFSNVPSMEYRDPAHPKLAGRLFVGGSIRKGGPVEVCTPFSMAMRPPDFTLAECHMFVHVNDRMKTFEAVAGQA